MSDFFKFLSNSETLLSREGHFGYALGYSYLAITIFSPSLNEKCLYFQYKDIVIALGLMYPRLSLFFLVWK